MNRQFDELTLSAYIDGELDPATMDEVEGFLEKDENARIFVLNAVGISARLRNSVNSALHERIPEHLITAVQPRWEKKKHPRLGVPTLLRMAAALLLVLLGFGGGTLLEISCKEHYAVPFAPLPARYSRVVDEALENNLSGTPRQWRASQEPLIVTVTPVKTYRDKKGLYYREYRLEVATGTERTQLNGLAYREGSGKWKTKALFY